MATCAIGNNVFFYQFSVSTNYSNSGNASSKETNPEVKIFFYSYCQTGPAARAAFTAFGKTLISSLNNAFSTSLFYMMLMSPVLFTSASPLLVLREMDTAREDL